MATQWCVSGHLLPLSLTVVGSTVQEVDMTHDELHYATDVTPDGAWNPVLTSTDIKFAAIMLREGLANDTR